MQPKWKRDLTADPIEVAERDIEARKGWKSYADSTHKCLERSEMDALIAYWRAKGIDVDTLNLKIPEF